MFPQHPAVFCSRPDAEVCITREPQLRDSSNMVGAAIMLAPNLPAGLYLF